MFNRWIGVFPRQPRFLLALLLLLGPLLATRAGWAQPGEVNGAIGDAVLILKGDWRFHPGDDMAWAQPNFDDSGWGVQNLTPPQGSYDPITGSTGFVPGWTAQGYRRLTGYAWYRMHVRLEDFGSRSNTLRLALAMPLNFDDAYQVFVDGRYVGEFGRFSPESVVFYNSQPRSFALPQIPAGGELTIAIRTWMDTATPLVSEDAGGLHGPPLLGESSSIDAMLRLEWDAVNRTQIGAVLSIIFLSLATLFGFALYWLDRHETAYLWLGAACSVNLAAKTVVMTGYYFMIVPMMPETILLDVFLNPLTLGLWAIFWAHWFRLEHVGRMTRVVWSLVALLMISMALVRPPLLGSLIPLNATSWMVPVSLVLRLSLGIALLWVTYEGIRKRTTDGWLALAPILLTIVWAYEEELRVIHVPAIERIYGVTITWGIIAILLMLANISILMMRRFIRDQRESAQLRLEIEQARQVQQVLIPEAIPAIPGFAVETEYRPAQQVGGDFFQILPAHNGGVLAIIGDVSGKGTPAAMTVSLLVGAIRTLAPSTQSPGEIVGVLNARMMGRGQGGFTTCLALRVDLDGTLTVANAGHLAPYVQGRELATSPALPLGLAEGSYSETVFRLGENEKLTLVTDGVLEARNKSGELFGFERTAAIAKGSAASIVQRAQEFGQADDITVLTITRLAAKQEAFVKVEAEVSTV